MLRTRLQYDINVQREREKKMQAVVFVSSFHPRGGVFCCSWRDGAGFFFSEAGRGGCFIFPRRDGVAFFFSTGRDVFFFFFFFSRAGTGRLFKAVAFFLAVRGKTVTPSRQRRFKPSRQPSM